MRSSKINIGIIGFGKVGKRRYESLKKNKNVNISKIFDINPKAIPQSKRAKSIKEIIHNNNIEAVFVCTPNYLNAKLTCLGLKNNKHIFCEKPPSVNLKEMKKVIDFEKKFKKKLMYGFNHRKHESIIFMKNKIVSGIFGKILWARGRYGKSVDNNFFNNWRSSKKKSGGGILIDQGIHMLDLLNFFCGDFDSIQSMKSNSYWHKNIEDNVFLNLKNSKKNILCSMHSTMTQWRHLFSLEIFLEKGYMVLNGLKTSSNSYGKESLTYALNRSLPPKASWSKEKKITFKYDNSWDTEVNLFIDSILKNLKIDHGSSSEAVNIMKIIEKVYSSKN